MNLNIRIPIDTNEQTLHTLKRQKKEGKNDNDDDKQEHKTLADNHNNKCSIERKRKIIRSTHAHIAPRSFIIPKRQQKNKKKIYEWNEKKKTRRTVLKLFFCDLAKNLSQRRDNLMNL